MSKTLTKSSLTIPLIGLGTWELRGRKCKKVVRKSLELGYRHIDTAAMYENESEVGSGIVDSGVDRKEIFLTTKINTIEVNNEGIVDAFHKSLSDLKTDYVDLLLIHWPTFSTNLGDMLEIMYGIKESKKARAIGVSNFNTALLNECTRLGFEDIYCNQVEYHPFLSQEILLKKMNQMGVIPVAYCPLCRGDVAKDSVIIELSKKYNKTPAQVTLRWIIQQNAVVIPKSAKKRRLKENIDIYDFEIDNQDMDRIHSLARGQRLVPNLDTNPLLGAWD
jgi:2,5-diketo-D-gluconate reductase B|tara:strand:- start:252 stop:1082 length:831 start_codon:yes stop_codon:yes gene_type:complete